MRSIEIQALDPDRLKALVGPVRRGVDDDPEAGPVLDECVLAWRELAAAVRAV
jgi:hypothetical protein